MSRPAWARHGLPAAASVLLGVGVGALVNLATDDTSTYWLAIAAVAGAVLFATWEALLSIRANRGRPPAIARASTVVQRIGNVRSSKVVGAVERGSGSNRVKQTLHDVTGGSTIVGIDSRDEN